MTTRIFDGPLLIVVLLCSGCGGGSDVTRGGDERLGSGSWTVDGITMGSSYEEVELLLGAGEQQTFRNNPAYVFKNRETTVTFNSERKVEHVSGQRLLRDGQPVLAVGQAKDSVVSTLGKGYVVDRFSPKTKGIFTVGSVPLWTENYYHDGTNRFNVSVNSDNVIGGIHYAPMEKFTLPKG